MILKCMGKKVACTSPYAPIIIASAIPNRIPRLRLEPFHSKTQGSTTFQEDRSANQLRGERLGTRRDAESGDSLPVSVQDKGSDDRA
jgi:hypothetical protein